MKHRIIRTDQITNLEASHDENKSNRKSCKVELIGREALAVSLRLATAHEGTFNSVAFIEIGYAAPFSACMFARMEARTVKRFGEEHLRYFGSLQGHVAILAGRHRYVRTRPARTDSGCRTLRRRTCLISGNLLLAYSPSNTNLQSESYESSKATLVCMDMSIECSHWQL